MPVAAIAPLILAVVIALVLFAAGTAVGLVIGSREVHELPEREPLGSAGQRPRHGEIRLG